MAKFKALSKCSIRESEMKTAEYWKSIDLLNETVKSREGAKNYVFYDGPPTANGKPGIHHVISRTLKDLTCRYKSMKGYRVCKKAGWDTHGLPVEIEVEKKLGLSSKKEIEAYGVEKFCKECRDSVFIYESMWREMSDRMAFLADMDSPYITLNNDYIETVWYLLDQIFKKGLIYEGAKILPYCPRCGTGLASHEVSQGYEMIKTTTVYATFKKKDEDAYFLAWTTTPWTLPSNVSLTVNPNITYVKVKYKEDFFYIAENLATKVLGEDYEVVEKYLGKDMEYWEYEQLIPEIEVKQKAFFVTLADYVTVEDGTGIVHTAPAFGEDDYQTGRRYNLPIINPVNEEGKFEVTRYANRPVMECDADIISYLFENKKALKKQKVEHNYPHCWRCHTPLIYYSKPSWYIEVTKYKDLLIKNAKEVNWFPDFVGEKRFGNWLENLNDWAISRSRYWGTPFNVWKCDCCGNTTSIGSRKELVERSIEEITEDIELHRPYVDNVHLKCEKCNGTMTREKDVIDVWFDSGAMPFAQQHYPFENKEEFNNVFPADFICEGIDQTRGWFYSLIAISTLITGKSPYKNVLVNDLILDADGKKMSKSRGNTIDPIELFDKFGADAVRFYSLYVSPPWIPTRFDVEGLREIESKFFRSFKNIYNFFQLYSGTDEIDPREFFVDYDKRPEIDRWILSRYNNLLKMYSENMDKFEITKVVRAISDFVIEDVSNWYIRRNRRRFWKTEVDDDKKAVYNTTYEILLGVSKLIAPFAPFISEEIYRNLTDKKSVHIDFIPDADLNLIDNVLEEKMEIVRNLVTIGRASREKVKIKVRQPLKEIVIDFTLKEKIGDLTELVKEELNVKEVVFEKDLSEFMNYSLKPNFKVCGKVLGSKIKEFGNYLNEVNPKAFIDELENGSVKIVLNVEEVEILKDYVDVKVNAKEGFDVTMENNLFVILDTALTDELLNEGFAREIVSKVQQLRKTNDYDVLDEIIIKYVATDRLNIAIENYKEFIMTETLATEIVRVENLEAEEVDFNGESGKLFVERI